MRVPAETLCDLCQGELTAPAVELHYPLDLADQAFISSSVREQVQQLDALNRLLLDVALPRTYRFDICRGCIDGLLPMLADLKTTGIRALVAQALRDIQRMKTS